MRLLVRGSLLLSSLLLASCSRFGPVYPPKPPVSLGAVVVDPEPSRVVAHLRVTSEAMLDALETSLPKTGEGTFQASIKTMRYAWKREAAKLYFDRGRVRIDVNVLATVSLPVSDAELPMTVHLFAEPILNAEYTLKLQSIETTVESTDKRLRAAEVLAGALKTVSEEITTSARSFQYSLRPLLGEVAQKIAKPLPLDLSGGNACVTLNVMGIEAGPTLFVDGIEKDIALVVAPAVTMPCATAQIGAAVQTVASAQSAVASPSPDAQKLEAPKEVTSDPSRGNRVTRFLESERARERELEKEKELARSLPPLANVPMVPPGPFVVKVPIAASFEEMTKAMGGLFTEGRYFFSKEYPGLYLANPQIYASEDKLVLQMRIGGPVHKLGMDFDINGDLYLSGHPRIQDNELSIPDLEPTIETKNLLLSIKAMTESDQIRDDARKALRLNLSERLLPVREKLGADLRLGDAKACFRGNVDKIEVTGVYIHQTHLRAYVAVTARARASMPCPDP
ncbi:MAG: DUF4403 family protein [Polyangiaceae bacterium]|nr:DUF4403 family protein [Polyangiaceae bacterium]